ncbi:trehalose-phosphatase [Polaromonas sp.]|uniref:trehalose-phosphatase n=1 Tax=Polaromonas sp. TaxID=1869339 RepID=UPI00351FE802
MQMSHETFPRISSRTALFLDFDGTLVEIASQPEAVVIPATLTSTLAALYGQLDGALALVSGRRLLDLDGFLAPLQLPAAVEHGAQRRNTQGLMISAPATDLRHVLAAAQGLALQHPALKLEHKNLALSLHYRHAPELETLCLQVMQAAVAESSGLQLMQGKCVIDLKPTGVSKGTAIAAFMAEAPFAGRVPVFAGDDVTDEDGFEEVQRMGGYAVKVGAGPTTARYRCAGVAELAAWLQSALAHSPVSHAESLPS